MSLLALSIAPLVLLQSAQTLAQSPPTVSVTPQQSADGASQIIASSFAGMGIEPSNLFSFTGGDQPNQLSINLLTILANYTGQPPHLRIGGNTGDNILYDSTYQDYSLYTVPHPTGQGTVPCDLYKIGPKYFEAIDRFPADTPITYGLNMAYEGSDYISRIVESAEAARSTLNNVALVSFEVGNEPDLYLQNSFRNGTWNGQIYTQQWLTRTNAIYEQVLKPNGIPASFFEPGCTASTIGDTFQIEMLASDGILKESTSPDKATYASSWNQHDYLYYIGVSTFNMSIDWMMNIQNTYAQFLAWLEQAEQAAATGHPYVLREMASVGPIGLQGVSNVFGATLWTLNFFLYAATIGVSSVQMHMTDDSWAAPWQPIDIYGSGPHVRTTYYAWAAFDQLIGAGCGTRIGNITISQFPNGYPDNLVAYASYQNDELAAMVFINTLPVRSSQPKTTVMFDLSLPNHSGQTLYLSYLTAPGIESTTGTVWNGISYEQSSDGSPSLVDSTVHTVKIGSNGHVSIGVRDASAVVAAFNQQIGTGPPSQVNATACKAEASYTANPTHREPSAAPLIPLLPSLSLPSSSPSPSSLGANWAAPVADGGGGRAAYTPSFFLSAMGSFALWLLQWL